MRLGVVTDCHLAPLPHRAGGWHNPYDFQGVRRRLDAAFDALSRRDVDAVAVLGDLADGGDAGSLDEAVARIAEGAPAPALVVPGNHDCEEAADGLAAAVRRAGRGRVGVAGSPVRLADTAVAGVGLEMLGEDSFAGRIALDGTRPTVVLSHFPAVSRRAALAAAGLKYAGDLRNVGEVGRVLASGRPTVVLSGHLHVRDAAAAGPVLQLSFPALIEPPFECAVVDVGGDPPRVRVEAIELQPPPDVALPVLCPPAGAWRFDDARWGAVRG